MFGTAAGLVSGGTVPMIGRASEPGRVAAEALLGDQGDEVLLCDMAGNP